MDLSLVDRLQILNYDDELRKEIKMKPMNRYYFLIPGNPGEQFHAFTSIAVWLLRKVGRKIEEPQEDDDPNFTISSILDNMRDLEIPVDFSPNKLKQGYGEYVIYILNKLSERALKELNYKWWPIEISLDQELDESNEINEDDQDIEEEDQEALDEEIYSDDSVDGAYLGGMKDEIIENHHIMNLPQDESMWAEEIEKVAPALRLRIAPSARDWRSHVQQLSTHKNELNEKADALGASLDRISVSVVQVLEAIRSREQLLATHIPPSLIDLKNEYEKTLATYKSVSVGVTQRQEVLNELVEKVETVKQKTELKGSAMNDTSPIVNIKKALVTLKKEIQQMDIQLAMLMWTVIDKQSKVKNRLPISVSR